MRMSAVLFFRRHRPNELVFDRILPFGSSLTGTVRVRKMKRLSLRIFQRGFD